MAVVCDVLSVALLVFDIMTSFVCDVMAVTSSVIPWRMLDLSMTSWLMLYLSVFLYQLLLDVYDFVAVVLLDRLHDCMSGWLSWYLQSKHSINGDNDNFISRARFLVQHAQLC